MKVLEQIIKRKGIPKAIYTDKAGWAGGGKRSEFSQFKRACEKLGIQLIRGKVKSSSLMVAQ